MNFIRLLKQGYEIIPKNFKLKLRLIFAFQLIKFLLEIFSIGILVPIIYIFAKGQESFVDKISDNKYLFFIDESIIKNENLVFIFWL